MADSIVDRIFDRLHSLTDYPGTFIRGLVRNSLEIPIRTASYALAIPTLYRRCIKNKLEMPRTRGKNIEFVNSDRLTSHVVGSAAGMVSGAFAGLTILGEGANYILEHTLSGDYKPLVVLGATNILSGVYELGRAGIQDTFEVLARRQMRTARVSAQQSIAYSEEPVSEESTREEVIEEQPVKKILDERGHRDVRAEIQADQIRKAVPIIATRMKMARPSRTH